MKKILIERAAIKYGSADDKFSKFKVDLEKMIKKGKIDSGNFGKINNSQKSFMQDLYVRGTSPAPNISIILKNKSFDYGPYLKF